MKGTGFSEYTIAQFQQYALEYQRNAFAVNAPTDVVRTITGREPEDYETIIRQYVSHTPEATRSLAIQGKFMNMMTAWMLRSGPKTGSSLALSEFSDRTHILLSADSSEWRSSHELQTNEPAREKTQT